MKHLFPKSGYDAVTGEWNDSLRGDFLWSNVNVSEAVPDVMTPSTWSLWWIYHYEASPFEFPGNYPFCGNICGRPYLNLSLIASLYRTVGRDVRKELQGDMIGSAPSELDIPFIPFSPLTVIWKTLPGLLKAQQQANRDLHQIPEFLTSTPVWCKATRLDIQATSDVASLLSLWQSNIRPKVTLACRMLRSVTMSMADPATKLRLDLNNLVGESATNSILSNLSSTSGELASLGPLVGLARVREGKMSREVFLERYGHRGPHEMELYAPGVEDNPDWLEKRLAEFNQSSTDVEALLAKQRAEHTRAWADFVARFPAKAQSTQIELEKVAAAAKNREAVRSEVARLARLVRLYLLRAGEVTRLGEDIFFLSLDEMAGLLASDRASIVHIPIRRNAYQRYSALPPYPAIIIGQFDPFAWATDSQRRSDYYDSRKVQTTGLAARITGFAGAAGVVEGIVRRLDKPEEGSQLQQGEILVTVTTNVGWTPLFPRLAAIVTDVGAPLSHAAIVARELGIPAVVGCGNATMLLKTGDRVRVDGVRGTVEILSR